VSGFIVDAKSGVLIGINVKKENAVTSLPVRGLVSIGALSRSES